MLQALATHAQRSRKPFVTVLHPAHEEAYVGSIKPKFNELNLPVFASFERAAAALARSRDYYASR
jgi:hypothetical protein